MKQPDIVEEVFYVSSQLLECLNVLFFDVLYLNALLYNFNMGFNFNFNFNRKSTAG